MLRILEIGVGYGRFAEALIRNAGFDLHIDMVDVVPSSLALAKEYLSKSGIEVTSEPALVDEDVSVCLHFPQSLDLIPDGSTDLVINIESFQEMTQVWVDSWLEVIENKTTVGSIFYQSNYFNYKNLFDLPLGSNWILETSIQHPRHWTDGHRTEVWRRVS